MPACGICKRQLDDLSDDIRAQDCGGDCLECMANFGDPECIAAMIAAGFDVDRARFDSDLNKIVDRMILYRRLIAMRDACADGSMPTTDISGMTESERRRALWGDDAIINANDDPEFHLTKPSEIVGNDIDDD